MVMLNQSYAAIATTTAFFHQILQHETWTMNMMMFYVKQHDNRH